MGHICEISSNMHGTRAMQFLIETVSRGIKDFKPQMLEIVALLQTRVKDLSLVSLGF